MKTRKRLRAWLVVFGLLTLFSLAPIRAKAQDQDQDRAQAFHEQDDQGDQQDPPGRVARLNYSQGSVSFQPAGEGDWVTAVPNRPMVTGDNLWADENSRAEAHIGSTALRLGARSGITFLNIDDRTVQIRVAQGSLMVRVRHVDDDDTYEVDTPNVAFTLLQPGEYRIDVSEDGSQTVTTVWQGRGEVTGGGFSYTVVGGQSATFSGTDHLDYDLEQVPSEDDFDQWAFERDQREDNADSANYVSREMTGYEDLDDNGDWSYVAGYGECWRPRVVITGWAPYRFGHWAWIGPWGWTWVGDEPWGFAPYHYGRWAYAGSGWFWVPGPVVVRPVWAPALVAFVGGGPGLQVAGGVGVGWFPLGPGEVFVPGYRVSRAYVNNVNITNTTVNITKVTNVYNTVIVNKTVNNITYVNQRVSNSVTVVSHDTFVNARPVGQNIVRVDARQLAAAPVSHVVAVEPVPQSVVGAGRPATIKPPAAVMSRQVVAVKAPPAPPRGMDQKQAQAGGHLNQQSLVRTQVGPVKVYQPSQTARPATTGTQNTQPANKPGGFRPFTPPPTQRPENERQATPDNRGQNANEGRPAPQETHPLVKPAPPVQQRSPEQEQQQERKFNTWEQQRPATPPAAERQAPRPPEQRQPEQKQEPQPQKKN
jgi:hypothetical protein